MNNKLYEEKVKAEPEEYFSDGVRKEKNGYQRICKKRSKKDR